MTTFTFSRARPRDQTMAWARRQRHALLSAEQSAALDVVYPSWRHTKDEVWHARLDGIEAFFKEHSRYPSQRASDPAEKLLGVWLKNNKPGGAQYTEERRALIDGRLAGWNVSRDEAWSVRLEEVAALIATLGRMPLMSGSPEERRGRKWLDHQASGSANRLQALDERIPGWR